ncbi:MAG: ATP-binding protein [Prevotella sp.]|jgi:DNA polymerase-3 subunit delta'
MQFNEVIGQHKFIEHLISMVKEGRVPHAMMFCGPEGNGKMALALAFASYLLGERYEGKSLLEKDSQIRNAEAMLHTWQHPDLTFTFPVFRPKNASAGYKPVSDDFLKEWRALLQKGPYFSLNQWMEEAKVDNQQLMIYEAESDALLHKLSLKSSMGGYKVCVIWLPERMNETCANKLLKLLEEPPSMTIFIMVCEEPEKLLETIRSRVQRMDIPRINTSDMQEALVKRRGLEESLARNVAHAAEGNWLKALEMLDAGNENRQFLDLYKILMRRAYMRDIKELKKWAENVSGYGREKQKRLLTYMLRMTRENFMFNFKQPELNYLTKEEQEFSNNFARFINERNVIEMTELLQLTLNEIGQNVNSKMVLFNMGLKMIILLRR